MVVYSGLYYPFSTPVLDLLMHFTLLFKAKTETKVLPVIPDKTKPDVNFITTKPQQFCV